MTKKDVVDGVEIRWSYRPDDRSKQGTTEVLPRDLARQKVAEGLAVLVPVVAEPELVESDAVTDAPRSAKKTTVPAVRES